MDSEFLTIPEAARLLRVKPNTIGNMMRKGVLKRGVHYWKRESEIGVRFSRQALIDWIMEGKEKPQEKNAVPMARGYDLG